MNIQNKKILVSFLFVLLGFVCFSQGDVMPPPPAVPPPGLAPIDGFVSLFLALAGIYGVRIKMKPKK